VNGCAICGHASAEHNGMRLNHHFVNEYDLAEGLRRVLRRLDREARGDGFDSNAHYAEMFPPTKAASWVGADAPDCGTCKFYDANGCLCRKRAPTSGWPVVNSGRDWCGDWERGNR
jgi:hypothetical protein